MTAIGVCGFGRCGSTMTMAMLHAGGVPPIDGVNPISYEGDPSDQPQPGRAIKLLDGALYDLPESPYGWRFIWMDRDPQQQARSAVKFLAWLGIRGVNRRKLASSYIADRPHALAALNRAGPVLELSYEWVLANPRGAAGHIARHLWPDVKGFDVRAAALAVHHRDARCLPHLQFEQGVGVAVNAETGVVTPPGEPLPPVVEVSP